MNFLKKILYTVIGLGLVLITLCIALYISLFSFLIHFNKYQNYNSFYELEKTKNFLVKIGALIVDKFIYNGSFLLPLLLIGLIILFCINYIKYILILLIPIVILYSGTISILFFLYIIFLFKITPFKLRTLKKLYDLKNKTCREEFNKKEFNKKVEYNKYKIVEIFKNYKIEIKNIKATIGHQITLYEIVPEVGVRIAKIKNLENEIALNLSAIHVRIIAPLPGKGTIGIEIPNKNPIPVYIKHVILSQIFKKAIMELPIIIGINIYNKPFIVDLTKMPHLLIAGATGQGKSVGLNAIIISLLCKKKHYELKFVMIDPKKVELYQYKKIDFFLAKIPNDDEYIITDANRAKDVLNALCKEMDRRYNILKKKMVRNIQEYNKKYKILPYIVLIIDEFADLIIKEIEIYILRLSRLSRAVGIHLIIATQRPSVNIITGIIKANFPARIAFKVASKVDSITILDTIGADKLMGKGDMLFYNGSEIIRLQCPFIDTHDIETIINNYKKTNKIMKNDNFQLPMPD